MTGKTWDDLLAEHGGPEREGWWVSLMWDELDCVEVFGPYASEEIAVAAMEDSLLITGICEDTNNENTLVDCYVGLPVTIERALGLCIVNLIDPEDPDHFTYIHEEDE